MRRVSFEVQAGQVLGLVEENGAGTPTLIAMLSDAVAPDGGAVAVDGVDSSARHPHLAPRLRIAAIRQAPILVPTLSMMENLLMGREPQRVRRLQHARLPVGARGDTHHLIRKQAVAGVAVLVVSSDLRELLSLANRLTPVGRGRVRSSFDGKFEAERIVDDAQRGASRPLLAGAHLTGRRAGRVQWCPGGLEPLASLLGTLLGVLLLGLISNSLNLLGISGAFQ